MKQPLRRWAAVAAFVLALASLSAMALGTDSVAVSHAQVWCPVGWYWNGYTNSCQPRPGPSVTACVSATGRRGYVSGGVCIGN